MKRLALAILLVAAASAFAVFNRPGAEATPPGATITVNTWLDDNSRDDRLSLREAMMLATGDLLFTLLSEEECAQVSTVFWLEEPIHWCAGAAGNPPGADYADTIVFEEGLALVITLNSALPPLGTGDDTVDGSSAALTIQGGGTDAFDCFEITSDGNTIRAFGVMECKTAVWIHGGKNNAIEPSYIWSSATGVSITGSGTSGNSVMRVLLQGNGRNIKISGGAHHNIIQANRMVNSTERDGVSIWGSGTDSNEVKGNWIGTNNLGEPQPNKVRGVGIGDGAQGNVIGGTGPDEGNVIAFNTEAGVFVQEGALYNTIRGNSIYSNGGKGIELASGGNAELAPPTVDSVGSVFGTACANCTIDVYSDEEDEGRVYEGSTTADGDGNWSFSGTPSGPNITATATDSDGNTSEFSAPLTPPWPAPSPSPAPSPTPSPTPVSDSDGDTVPDDVEEAFGSDPDDPDSTPEALGFDPDTCTDGVDNDADGKTDAEDEGCAVALTRTLVWGPGWHNVTWSGASTPEEAFACAAGNYAAAYRLVSGGWERYFPDRPDLSNMTDLAQYDAFLILVTADVTCQMEVADPLGIERTVDWGVGWQSDGWTGADDMPPEDVFDCAEGSYAAAYRLVGGGWERYFPDRPVLSNMGPLDEYDAFLILVTAPVSCIMAVGP